MSGWQYVNPFAPFQQPTLQAVGCNVYLNGCNITLETTTSVAQIADATDFGRAWLQYNNLPEAINAGTFDYITLDSVTGWGAAGLDIARLTTVGEVNDSLGLNGLSGATNFGKAWLHYATLNDAINDGAFGVIALGDVYGWGAAGYDIARMSTTGEVTTYLGIDAAGSLSITVSSITASGSNVSLVGSINMNNGSINSVHTLNAANVRTNNIYALGDSTQIMLHNSINGNLKNLSNVGGVDLRTLDFFDSLNNTSVQVKYVSASNSLLVNNEPIAATWCNYIPATTNFQNLTVNSITAIGYSIAVNGSIDMGGTGFLHNVGGLEAETVQLRNGSGYGVIQYDQPSDSILFNNSPLAATWSNYIPATTNFQNVYIASNLTLNQTTLSNVNEIYTNAFFFSIPDSSDFINFRYASGYVSYSFNSMDFVPIAKEWSHFPSDRDVDFGGFNIGNVGSITCGGGTVTNLNVDTINGASYPPEAVPPASWADYAASTDVNMDGHNIINAGSISVGSLTDVTSINGSAYPPSGGDASAWATFPASTDINANSKNLAGVDALSCGSAGVTGALTVGSFSTTGSVSLNGAVLNSFLIRTTAQGGATCSFGSQNVNSVNSLSAVTISGSTSIATPLITATTSRTATLSGLATNSALAISTGTGTVTMNAGAVQVNAALTSSTSLTAPVIAVSGGRTGTFTMTAGTATVSLSVALAAANVILLSLDTAGGTVGAPFVSSRTNAGAGSASFVALSTSGTDTSTYRYVIIN